MTATVGIDRPPVAKPVSRPRSRKRATVSASALAQHLDCSRTYIGKLEAEGVIQRQGDGFPLDQSRVAYLRYLRRERRQSPLAEAEHAKAKTELLQVRIEEKYLAAPNGIGVIVGGRLFRHCERSKGIHRTTAKTWVAPSLRSSR
jgi:hypothetical protein